jgi:Ca2+-transporting ATPase
MAVRSDRRSLFAQGLFTNKTLLVAVVATVILQIAVIYIPALNSFFHTSPLTWKELLTAIVASSIVFWAVELEKLVKRRQSRATIKRRDQRQASNAMGRH